MRSDPMMTEATSSARRVEAQERLASGSFRSALRLLAGGLAVAAFFFVPPRVSAEESRSDESLRSRIEQSLVIASFVDRFDIRIDVQDGVATLRGTVATAYERDQAGEAVRQTKGVKRVENELSIGESDARP